MQTKKDSNKNTEVRITRIIQKLGIPANISGYQYLRSAILYAYNYGKRYQIVGDIYPKVAEEFGTDPRYVERNIRYAIEKNWKKNHSYVEELFGNSNKKPSNGMAITVIADYLHMQDRM